jgi:TPR repeat protein
MEKDKIFPGNSGEIAGCVKQDKQAVKKGDAHARYCLAVNYETGVDVPRDAAKTAYWWKKATEQYDEQAIEGLKLLKRG